MKTTYTTIGLVLIVLIVGAWYLAPKSEEVRGPTLEEELTEDTRMSTLALTSAAFGSGGSIPAKFTCDGEKRLSPPLSISGVPDGTKSLVLIMDDPDVPKELIPEGVFDHWVVYNIPPGTREIPEGSEVTGTAGANNVDELSYTGPCPPPQYEPSEHRYFFRLYALDAELSFDRPPTKQRVNEAMQGHVLDQAELVGRYKRI